MDKNGKAALVNRVVDLQTTIKGLATDSSLDELLRLIHRPGWTTPTESFFVERLVGLMNQQVAGLREHHEILLTGARKIAGITADDARNDNPREGHHHGGAAND